jgi:hypothetical protein
MDLSSGARRAVQALASVAIVLIVLGMAYAAAIGWMYYDRIGV